MNTTHVCIDLILFYSFWNYVDYAEYVQLCEIMCICQALYPTFTLCYDRITLFNMLTISFFLIYVLIFKSNIDKYTNLCLYIITSPTLPSHNFCHMFWGWNRYTLRHILTFSRKTRAIRSWIQHFIQIFQRSSKTIATQSITMPCF